MITVRVTCKPEVIEAIQEYASTPTVQKMLKDSIMRHKVKTMQAFFDGWEEAKLYYQLTKRL